MARKKHKNWVRRDKRALRFAALDAPVNPRVAVGHNSGLSPSDLVTAGLLNLAIEQALTTRDTGPKVTNEIEVGNSSSNSIDAGGASDGFSGGGSTGEF